MPKILHLTLKRKWFDLIARGEKNVEYRDVKEYWVDRLITFDDDIEYGNYIEYIKTLKSAGDRDLIRDINYLYGARFTIFDEVWFYNGGYCDSNKFPFMRVQQVDVGIKDGKFNIHLGEILEIKNWCK